MVLENKWNILAHVIGKCMDRIGLKSGLFRGYIIRAEIPFLYCPLSIVLLFGLYAQTGFPPNKTITTSSVCGIATMFML